jgi:hypothetical protein
MEVEQQQHQGFSMDDEEDEFDFALGLEGEFSAQDQGSAEAFLKSLSSRR